MCGQSCGGVNKGGPNHLVLAIFGERKKKKKKNYKLFDEKKNYGLFDIFHCNGS